MSDAVQQELMPAQNILEQIDRLSAERRSALIQLLKERESDELLREIHSENEQLRKELALLRHDSQEQIDTIADGVREVADAGARRLFASDKYYTRTALGDLFSPAISAKRMTKILRVVGIMGARDMVLSPFTSGSEPLAKRKPWAEYPTWVFHIQKVKARMDSFLTINGYFEDFHNTTTKDERDALIDMLFEEFVA